MNITQQEAKVLIYALDVLTNIQGDTIEHDALYRKLYTIARVEE